MTKEHNPKLCTIIARGGQHLLITPGGEELYGLVFTRVTDDVQGTPTAIIKLMVNIKNTEKDEA